MKLILGGINGHYLRNIIESAKDVTEEVLAAVAYASDPTLLFDWCWENSIPLKFYGRLDDSVAVSVPILEKFLNRSSPKFVCRLVKFHHAKVIWWRGYGMYIGSANLSDRAWYKNVEAGCFFAKAEITPEMVTDVQAMFAKLQEKSTPLNEELLKVMTARAKALAKSAPDSSEFWNSPSFTNWDGLSQTSPKGALETRRNEFLKEWHETLQDLRDIGQLLQKPENRPTWVTEFAPAGTQTDQFLHAHYYQRIREGKRARYVELYEENKTRRNDALKEAIEWWRKLPAAPNQEDEMLNTTAPFLRDVLTESELSNLDEGRLREIFSGVHSIKGYAKRARNTSVGLQASGTTYTVPQKVDALARRIWGTTSAYGKRVDETLLMLLYGGPSEELPNRLWDAVHDPKWKIEGLGISALGEIVGWALPDTFPPRNGRTSKALKSLGYDVTVHVE
jgi:hypothetical protein